MDVKKLDDIDRRFLRPPELPKGGSQSQNCQNNSGFESNHSVHIDSDSCMVYIIKR